VRRYAKIRILITVLALVLFTTVNAYAISYVDFRDGDISMTFPDGWTYEETDASFSEDEYAEEIFRAEDNSGDLMMDLQYIKEGVQDGDYIYLDSQDEVDYYYDAYGEAVVRDAYTEFGWTDNFQITEAGSYFGEYDGYVILDVSYDDEWAGEKSTGNELVYLTAQMTRDDKFVVHSMFAFYKEDGSVLTEEEKDVAEDIVDSYYDYSYINEYAGVEKEKTFDSDKASDIANDVFDGIMEFIAAVAPFVLIVALIFRAKKKKKGESFDIPFADSIREKISSIQTDNELKTYKQETKKIVSRQTSQPKARSSAKPKDTRKMYEQERQNAEVRYHDSLKTLHKSGLLTKAEMDDMLERHQRSRSRYRKH